MKKPSSLIVKREAIVEEGNIDTCDYLTIYDKDTGEILSRSDCTAPEDWINLEYEILVFVAAPGYESPIYIEWNSLVKLVES